MEMQTYQNKINFTSRNSTIRFADDMMRKVKQEYPCISPTKLLKMKNSNKFFDYIHFNLVPNLSAMRVEMRELIFKKNNILNIWKIISDAVKRQHLGNCGELTSLTEATVKVNGIKDCYTAGIKSLSDSKPINHSLLYVNAKKPYVIDTWLGFADYVPNALKRYEIEFDKSGETLIFYKQIPNHELTPFKKLELECILPNLMIKRGSMS